MRHPAIQSRVFTSLGHAATHGIWSDARSVATAIIGRMERTGTGPGRCRSPPCQRDGDATFSLGGLLMNRFRMTIRSGMALVVFTGLGFAALRDASMWWVAGVLGCLIGLLLTACVGAIYRTGRRARVLAGDRRLRWRLSFARSNSLLRRHWQPRRDHKPGARLGRRFQCLAQPRANPAPK